MDINERADGRAYPHRAGGAAFPRTCDASYNGETGMSLRDWFAGQDDWQPNRTQSVDWRRLLCSTKKRR